MADRFYDDLEIALSSYSIPSNGELVNFGRGSAYSLWFDDYWAG